MSHFTCTVVLPPDTFEDHDPPLVRVSVIEELSDQFEHVPTNS